MPQFCRCANVFLPPIPAIMDATIISTFLYGQNALRRIQVYMVTVLSMSWMGTFSTVQVRGFGDNIMQFVSVGLVGLTHMDG